MTNQSDAGVGRPLPGDQFLDDGDEPLDTEVDENAVDSADADEQAAREGTKGEGDQPV